MSSQYASAHSAVESDNLPETVPDIDNANDSASPQRKVTKRVTIQHSDKIPRVILTSSTFYLLITGKGCVKPKQVSHVTLTKDYGNILPYIFPDNDTDTSSSESEGDL